MQNALKLFLTSLLTWAVSAHRADVHPVEKVIGLLEGLIDKVETEGTQETDTFAKFARWCTNSISKLKSTIVEQKASIESLSDRVQSKEEEMALLKDQIDALDAELLKLQAADAAADDAFTTQQATSDEALSDIEGTIAAIKSAMDALAKESGGDSLFLIQKLEKVMALTEVTATQQQREVLSAFVQQPPTVKPSLKATGMRDKHKQVYQGKTDVVVELLKDLLLKFEDEKVEANKQKTNAKNQYELAKASRKSLTDETTTAKEAKTTALGNSQQAHTEATGLLNSTNEDMAADQATLAQTDKACKVKQSEWDERSDTRSKELEAMRTAIKILTKATGVRTEKPTNPVPPSSPVSLLLQEDSSDADLNDPRVRALQLLRSEATATHSRSLERLAQEIASHMSGPFDQVLNMIQKMIFHLMDEQKDEDKHKLWCDLELNKTDLSITNKDEKMAELEAKLENSQATILTLTKDMQDASDMVESISTHMEEATRIREDGKAENKKALKDAQTAQAAVSSAIAVLEAFYKESGMVKKEDWELLQRGVDLPEQPSTWDASYTGTSDPTNQPEGIITVLKAVSADFASMEAQTRAQEESDQNIYEEDMKLSTVEKARRNKEADVKALEKKRLVENIASMTSSRKHVGSEKEATEQYLKDLQHACVDGDSTYGDRKAARTKEVDALKQAKDLLATAFEAKKSNASKDASGEAKDASFLSRRFLRH